MYQYIDNVIIIKMVWDTYQGERYIITKNFHHFKSFKIYKIGRKCFKFFLKSKTIKTPISMNEWKYTRKSKDLRFTRM